MLSVVHDTITLTEITSSSCELLAVLKCTLSTWKYAIFTVRSWRLRIVDFCASGFFISFKFHIFMSRKNCIAPRTGQIWCGKSFWNLWDCQLRISFRGQVLIKNFVFSRNVADEERNSLWGSFSLEMESKKLYSIFMENLKNVIFGRDCFLHSEETVGYFLEFLWDSCLFLILFTLFSA